MFPQIGTEVRYVHVCVESQYLGFLALSSGTEVNAQATDDTSAFPIPILLFHRLPDTGAPSRQVAVPPPGPTSVHPHPSQISHLSQRPNPSTLQLCAEHRQHLPDQVRSIVNCVCVWNGMNTLKRFNFAVSPSPGKWRKVISIFKELNKA